MHSRMQDALNLIHYKIDAIFLLFFFSSFVVVADVVVGGGEGDFFLFVSLGCPGACLDQASNELRDPPASVSRALGDITDNKH